MPSHERADKAADGDDKLSTPMERFKNMMTRLVAVPLAEVRAAEERRTKTEQVELANHRRESE